MRETKLEKAERVLLAAARDARAKGLIIVRGAFEYPADADDPIGCCVLGALEHCGPKLRRVRLHLSPEQYDAIEMGFDGERLIHARLPKREQRPEYYRLGARLRRWLRPVTTAAAEVIHAERGMKKEARGDA